MARKKIRSNYEATNDLNVWPSFTDLMANAFMIISLFLLLALFKSLFLKYTAEETELNLSETERQVRVLKRQIATLENELGESVDEIRQLRRGSSELARSLQQSNRRGDLLALEVERLKSAPPVVVIQDSGEYQFASGSAELPQGLKDYLLNDLADRIEQISQQRNLYVVEIIGHTDGQINVNGYSNLDQELEAVANGKQTINSLNPGSNVDLGLMRSLEVVKELQELQRQGRLQGVQFRAYSAAQLLLPSGEFANTNRQNDPKRRRIEIRFSPLGKAETIR
jgi:flagellar motor protein MotB